MMKSTLAVLTALLITALHISAAAKRNVLSIIADDASRHFGGSHGCKWIKRPNIDRLAKQGLVFDNACAPTSKFETIKK